MNDFWNERYSTIEYAYGEAPNTFVKQQLEMTKPGKALFPAEGEGRNAVYAATQGWEVTAFDPSFEGKKKAEKLAKKQNVTINYLLAGYTDVDFPLESFNCLVLNFAHMPSNMRPVIHKKLSSYLKKGGTLILEAFSKKQLGKNTGGPQNIDLLFSVEELRKDFSTFSELHIEETETKLDEGLYHRGMASVIRVHGVK